MGWTVGELRVFVAGEWRVTLPFFPFNPQPRKCLCMALIDRDTMSRSLQVIYLASKARYTICPLSVCYPYMVLPS